ncbi:MAG: hypothetical protein ACKV2V_26255 [Blastocatellia bacterium]
MPPSPFIGDTSAAPADTAPNEPLAHVLHDFRNQLGGLKLYASLLRKQIAQSVPANAPPGAGPLELADKLISGLEDVAQQSYLLSHLFLPDHPAMAPVDLSALLPGLLLEMGTVAARRGVRINMAPPGARILIHGNAPQLLMALRFILERLLSLCEQNATVTITVRHEAPPALEMAADVTEPTATPPDLITFGLSMDERITLPALKMAIAGKIMRAHGWQAAIRVANETGALASIRFTS